MQATRCLDFIFYSWFWAYQINLNVKSNYYWPVELSNKSILGPSPPRSSGLAHINELDWAGPLVTWTTKIEPNLNKNELWGPMNQFDPYFNKTTLFYHRHQKINDTNYFFQRLQLLKYVYHLCEILIDTECTNIYAHM